MTSRKHTFSCTLLIVVFSATALCGQTGKQSAPARQESLPTLSAQEIFKRVSPSVVVVESLDAGGKVAEFGSGVVIAPDEIITNRHVIEDGVSFGVEHNGKKWPAKLIRVDPDHDLAELSVASLNAPAVSVLDSSKLAIGETVYAIGSPEGLELTISEGLISGLREFDKGRVIQTSAAISPGSSGGGLFDAEGRLVGITTFYLKEGQSLNFALPAEWILALTEQSTGAFGTSQGTSEFAELLWFEFGYAAFKAGKYEVAATAYKKAIQLEPEDEAAWFELGIAYDTLGEQEKAVSAYQEALRIKPEDELAWRELGSAYSSLGDGARAASAYQEAVRIKPDDGDAWLFLGVVYDNLGQEGKALKAFEAALRVKPDDETAWDNFGRILVKVGRYQNAVDLLRQVVNVEPTYERLWIILGSAYVGLGEYGKAVAAGEQAVKLKPGDAFAWYSLGLAYKADGQHSEVIKAYERLKTLDSKLADKFFREEVLP